MEPGVRMWSKVGSDDVTMQDVGATALIVASQNGHIEIARALLESGANVNQGRTVSIVRSDGRGEDDRISLCVVGSLSFVE